MTELFQTALEMSKAQRDEWRSEKLADLRHEIANELRPRNHAESTCSACCGSGEGRTPDSVCRVCRGTGE